MLLVSLNLHATRIHNQILKGEPRWTKKMASDILPKSFFEKSQRLWRPGIFSEPTEGCHDVTIPVFIKTSADNFEFRKTLRENFLREEFKGETLKQYFVLGKTESITDRKFTEIKKEAAQNDDIIIGKHLELLQSSVSVLEVFATSMLVTDVGDGLIW